MTVVPYVSCRDHVTVLGMGIHQVTSRRRTAPRPRQPYRGDMDEATPTSPQIGSQDRPSLDDLLRSAGIPAAPPATAEQVADLEQRLENAARLPRRYGPKQAV